MTGTNRQRGLEFKRRVLIYLLEQGLFGARITPERNRMSISEQIGDGPQSDLQGLEPWVVDVRTSMGFDFAAALVDAERAAHVVGSDWFVSVQPRRGWPIQDSYCVMPLSVMTRLLKGEVPQRPQ